jgi:hypothetical protein
MEDTSGFYKEVNGEWWYAPNFVYHKDYTLHRDNNREPIDGWQWCDEAPQEYLDYINSLNYEI